MNIATTRFGAIEVPEASVVTLPHGIIGLPHLKRLAILEHEETGWFQWWQAVDSPRIALMTVDPGRLVAGYDLSGVEEDLRGLDAVKPSTRIVAALISLTDGTMESASVNLLAPIVVNRVTREGRQIVLPEGRYPIDFRLASADRETTSMAA